MRRVVTQSLGIVLAAAALGLLQNALRGRDAIEIGRAYFTAPSTPPTPPPAAGNAPTGPGRPAAPDLAGRAAREFTVIDAARAWQLYEASRQEPAHVQFLDARSEAHFQKDHVPGALQLDYYNLPRDIAEALPFLQVIPWLVVYCESATCEDGLLLCRALRDDYGMPKERILLYVDGLADWRQRKLPLLGGHHRW